MRLRDDDEGDDGVSGCELVEGALVLEEEGLAAVVEVVVADDDAALPRRREDDGCWVLVIAAVLVEVSLLDFFLAGCCMGLARG